MRGKKHFFSCKCYKCHNLHVEPFKIILKIFSIHYSILKLFIESLQRSLYVTLPCPQSVEQLSFKIEEYQKYREKKKINRLQNRERKNIGNCSAIDLFLILGTSLFWKASYMYCKSPLKILNIKKIRTDFKIRGWILIGTKRYLELDGLQL